MKQARVLSDTELKRVLAVIAAGKHARRNRLAVLLSHYAGLRVGEISSLRWSDVLGPDGTVVRSFRLHGDHTKSGETRTVHLSAKLSSEIDAHRHSEGREPKRAAPLVASQKRGPFSPNSLCQLFGRLYARAGIVGGSSHSGRRWFITKLAHGGISPKVIMKLAGHRSLATTQRYIEVNDEMMAAAVDTL